MIYYSYMMKLNNKLNISSLGVLGIIILAGLTISPTSASAVRANPYACQTGAVVCGSNPDSSHMVAIPNPALTAAPIYATQPMPRAQETVTTNPVPVIRSITPSSTKTASKEITIDILGENFIPTSIAKWNSSNRAT